MAVAGARFWQDLDGLRSLGDAIRAAADALGDKVAVSVLGDGEALTDRLTYEQLDRGSRAVGMELAQRVGPGARVLICCEPGLDFIRAFLGTLYRGAVPVPVPVPRFANQTGRVTAIIRDAGVSAVIARDAGLLELPATMPIVSPAGAADPGGWTPTPTAGDALALLQYTSGSTGSPKGVMVSHANLLANSDILRRTLRYDEDSVSLTWLPPSHDMGLIEGLLQPLLHGTQCMLMPPEAFLRRPLRWLKAVSRHRVTHSGGPNFAYALCAERKDHPDAGALDLSSWRLAYSGAEPIRFEVLDRFARAFAPNGFRRESLHASYGLAEATLLVSDGPADPVTLDADALAAGRAVPAGDAGKARTVVRCGRPDPAMQVRILDPQTGDKLPERMVGEICLAGASVTRGYWAGEEKPPRGSFHLAADGAAWLRTGDLGFLDGGQLAITGRLKDLIIVNGRNIYPQDVEAAAKDGVAALRRMPVAFDTFGLPGQAGGELVVAYESPTADQAVIEATVKAVRRAVAEAIEVDCGAILALAHGEIRYTTSGKVMRGDLRRRYGEGTLKLIHEWRRPAQEAVAAAGGDGIEDLLLARLGAAARDRSATLAELGGESLFATELAHAIEEARGGAPHGAQLLRMTIGEILALPARPAAPTPPAEPAAPDPAAIPANHAQRGLFYVHRLWGERDPFVLTLAGRLPPQVDASRFAAALRALVGRHALLRSRFEEVEGEAAVVFAPVADADAIVGEVDDPSGLRFRARLADPRAIKSGGLFEAQLHRTDGEGTLLLLRAHHAVADFTSLGVAWRELAALHEGAVLPAPAPAALPAALEAGALRDDVGTRAFWRERLADAPLGFELPLDHQRPAAPTFEGGRESLRLGAATARAVAALARSRRSSAASVLLAGFIGLCARQADRGDVLVGVPLAARESPRVRGNIGLLARIGLIHVRMERNASGADLLAATEAALFEQQLRQPFALDLLLRDLPSRPPNDTPVPRLLFNILSSGGEDAALARFASGIGEGRLSAGTLECELVEAPPAPAYHDLTLHVVPEGSSFRLVAHYARELFRPERIRRLLGQYETLLAALAEAPASSLRAAPLLPAEEVELLDRFAGDCDTRAPATSLHALFERQAERTPDASAVETATEKFSYRELDARAAAIAAQLREQGVAPGDRVGIHLPRAASLLVAILGTLKAGAAYVPMDPRYPAERLAGMLEDSRARIVITLDRPDWMAGLATLSPLAEPLAAPGPAAASPDVPPDAAAYVLFTSGTTGRPKGVVISHRSAAGLVAWADDRFGQALDRVFASTSASFDLSVFEMFAPLSRGGAVILAESLLDLPRLGVRLGPTLASGVPSVFAALLDVGALPPLRALAVAGEPLSRELAGRLLAASPGVRLFDLYGPTEVTTYATGGERRPGELANIGRPLPWTRCYLLDQAMQRAPAGATGEIWLGGDRLASGYIGRPDWTADRFRPDPFAGRPGALMYRTGDAGCFRPDGTLLYRGRLDRQIKLRGYRIEQAEIESVLEAQPAVRQAAVLVAAGPGASGERLVACVAPAGGVSEDALRAHAGTRLPPFMVPTLFRFFDELPVTANGKLDRARLAELAAADDAAPAPQLSDDPLVARVAELLAEVLGKPGLGHDEDLFTLGGTSLDAVRVSHALRRAFGADVPLRSLFDAATPTAIATLVAALAGQDRAALAGEPAPEGAAGTAAEQPLSFLQQQIWYGYRLNPMASAYHLPLAIRLPVRLPAEAADAALQELHARHPALRMRLLPGELPRQAELGDAAAARVEHATGAAGAEAAEAALAAWAREPFDLGREPPLRLRLADVDDGGCLVGIIAHHLMIDGASLGLLLDEFVRLLGMRLGWTAAPLPRPRVAPPPSPAPDPADAGRERAFWQEMLAGAQPAALPPSAAATGGSPDAGEVAVAEFDAELGERLRALARAQRTTPFAALLAGFLVAAARWQGDEDLTVATPVSLRDAFGAERAVGMFVQPALVRVRLRRDMTFEALLKAVRAALADALDHAELPYEQVLADLPGERPYGDPFYRILFASQDGIPPAVAAGGIQAPCIALPTGEARADLTVLVHAHPAGPVRCAFEYRTARYTREDIDAALAAWQDALAALIRDPGAPLDAIWPWPQKAKSEAAAPVRPQPPVPALPDDTYAPALAAIWRDLLGVAPSPTQTFFEAGGNSLLAIRMLARLEQATGVRLALTDLFTNTAFADLVAAVSLRKVQPLLPSLPAPPVEPEPLAEAPPSLAQEQLLFFERLHPGSPLYNVGSAIALDGPVEPERLAAAIDAVMARHAALRLRIRGAPPSARQQVRPDGQSLPLEVVRLALDAEARSAVAGLAQAFLARPFDLAEADPFRAQLIVASPDSHVLVLCAHHLAIDARSLQIVTGEIGLAYRGEPLPAAGSFGPLEFAEWERSWLAGDAAKRAADHWRARLAGTTPALGLPFTAGAAEGGGTVERTVPPALVAALRGAAGRHQSSLLHMILAAYVLLLRETSGRSTFVFGFPVSSRPSPHLDAVGFFSNTVPFRVDLDGISDVGGLLALVRDGVAEAQDWGWLPLPRILDAWQPPRDLDRPSLFHTLFAMEEGGTPEIVAGGTRRLSIDLGLPRCDLLLSARDDADGLHLQLQHAAPVDPATPSALADDLLRLLRLLADHRLPAPAPRDRKALATAIEAIWKDVLGAAKVRRDLSFFEQGGSSLLLVSVQSRLETAIGREVPLARLFACPRIDDLAAALAQGDAAAPEPARAQRRPMRRPVRPTVPLSPD